MADRDYNMGNPLRDRHSSVSVVMLLVIANVVTYLYQVTTVQTLYGVQVSEVTNSLSLVATDVRKGEIYRLFTYMFLHGGFFHIFFNMWGLYLFGSLVEQRIGAARFFNLYFISGLCGAGLWMLFNWNNDIPCVGASGAILGITLAAAMFYPDMMIMLLIPPIPMKMKTFAVVFSVVSILLLITGDNSGIAHLVHLGGFIGGYLYIKLIYKNEVWDIFSIFKFKKKRSLYSMDKPPAGWSVSDRVSQAELDRILDKISSGGINSLSEQEMEKLRKAREQMHAERKG
ncbi:MAG TPA: hypothetical protein DCZ94_00925 [Lentisphaeria bacterium]|nr:MAG: hypothetical protein A2X48_11845 [Lentisphaerae bacterium GWF2_49_21]HBC85493.1 hypothetical protein [Lentisphaeria bacterium]